MGKVENILSSILNIDSVKITDETSPDNTPEWDSMNGLLMITEFEKIYGLKFSLDEVMSVKNVRDIKKILIKHGVNINED